MKAALTAATARWLPTADISSPAFKARNRMLRAALLFHLVLLLGFLALVARRHVDAEGWLGAGGLLDDRADVHLLVTAGLVLVALAAYVVMLTREVTLRTAMAAPLGLLSCAGAFVTGSGGEADMYFDYFVVIVLIGLLQDWRPFAVAIGFLLTHHGAAVVLVPELAFAGQDAREQPVTYAVVHLGFVLALVLAQIWAWRLGAAAEAELRRVKDEAELMALVARYTDHVVVITDAEGRVEWVNAAFSTRTGYSAEEVLGRPRLEFFHGDPSVLAEIDQQVDDLATAVDIEFRTADRAGEQYWVALEVQPVVVDGRVVRCINIERDVTARRRTEQEAQAATSVAEALAKALDREKTRLAGIISAIPHLVYWKDATGRFAGVNEAFLEWLGHLPSTSVLGRSSSELDTDAPLLAELAPLESEVLRTGTAVIDRKVVVPTADCTPRTLLISVLSQSGPRGEQDVLIGVGADVSHVAELEQQLARVHRLESVGQLAAGVAHEINTPVQFVSDNVRFVAEAMAEFLPGLQQIVDDAAGPMSDEQLATALRRSLVGFDADFLASEIPSALTESLEGLERVAQIVRAMKEFSHPGNATTEFDLNRAVDNTVQVSRNEWKYIAAMEVDLDPEMGLVTCHEGDIKQVVLNLIVNAAHAVDERREKTGSGSLGSIRVRTKRDPDAVRISVSDDGVGMDAATQQHIFDPFFTTKAVGKGTGQGLNLAHTMIVKKLGGSISVDSTVGVGTTFTVAIPTTPAPASVPAPREPALADGRPGALLPALADPLPALADDDPTDDPTDPDSVPLFVE